MEIVLTSVLLCIQSERVQLGQLGSDQSSVLYIPYSLYSLKEYSLVIWGVIFLVLYIMYSVCSVTEYGDLICAVIFLVLYKKNPVCLV